jgi:pseudaminic acid biosynthesis-associated methylase
MAYETEQEQFWAGEFGSGYIERNSSESLLTSKMVMWARMLRSASSVSSVTEFGCNIGLNLLALHRLDPRLVLEGVEINAEAAALASARGIGRIHTGSIVEPLEVEVADLTCSVGVLIHINPALLDRVYENLVRGSRRYVLIAEYYNPTPVAIPYRGHSDRLFKRDFAGELIDSHGLSLVDYGFWYHRDRLVPQDDISWFLLERR